MKSTWFAKRLRQETGSLIVFAAISMIALFAFAALTIDVVRYCQQKRDLQSATDAASLAGALLLTNSPQNVASITAYATSVALTNGVKVSELGTISVGQWVTNAAGQYTFVANASPYTAVRVPAQRSMGTTFGSVLGMTQMMPAVQSVAMLEGAGSAFGGGGTGSLIPFGMSTNQASQPYYVQYHVTKGDIFSTGNFGKLDFSNLYPNHPGFQSDMQNGCGCTLSIGQQVNVITGNSNIYDGWSSITPGTVVVVPIVYQWPSGNSGQVTIEGFFGVKFDGFATGSNKGNWDLTLENVPITLGGSGGGTTNSPYASARVLVQ